MCLACCVTYVPGLYPPQDFHERACCWLPGVNRRAVPGPAGEDTLGIFNREPAAASGLIVAGQAVRFENRLDVVCEGVSGKRKAHSQQEDRNMT